MIGNYDGYVYGIAVLLPIAASMLILQTNPYNALVMRGILGAVSALLYTILGAPDVALTEALVGAFLATMLYAVAVRSSLVLRLGVVESFAIAYDLEQELSKIYLPHPQPTEGLESELVAKDPDGLRFKETINALKNAFSKHYMRVELVPFVNISELEQALIDKDVHAILDNSQLQNPVVIESESNPKNQNCQIKIRLQRLYEIMQNDPILSNPELAHVELIYQK